MADEDLATAQAEAERLIEVVPDEALAEPCIQDALAMTRAGIQVTDPALLAEIDAALA